MEAPLQPTNITPFSLKENNIKKQKFMNNRFPKLKGVVYRYVQLLSFMEKTSTFIISLEEARGDQVGQIIIVINIFTYLYNTRDIWASIDKFCTVVNKKMIELSQQEPFMLKKYLLRFGYICPYPKRNQEICSKRVNGTLCKTHSKCQDRLHSRILYSLPSLPTDLSNIVFHYSLPYSRD
jgi:hypothetical protein